MAKYGMPDTDGISGYLKVFIEQDGDLVVGYIGDGASKQLSNMWQNPFEGDTVGQAGGAANKLSDLFQVQTDNTTKSVMNTALVWEGVTPIELNLPVYFKAYGNAKNEVDDAIMFLEKFASPELNDVAGVGAIPKPCQVNIGQRVLLPNCRIRDISSELDVPRTNEGYMTRNTVQLSISMERMTNRSQIENLYK